MKKLSRIAGYRDSEIRRFNTMYECLVERIAEDEAAMEESFYSAEELQAFRCYLVLAQADENKRTEAMRYRRKIEDFTSDDISRFDHMQEVLTEFNRLADDPDIDLESIMALYSDIEMVEHSQYREIWIARQCENL